MQHPGQAVPLPTQAWHAAPCELPLEGLESCRTVKPEEHLFALVPGHPCELPQSPAGKPPVLTESPIMSADSVPSKQSSLSEANDHEDMLMLQYSSAWTGHTGSIFFNDAGSDLRRSVHEVSHGPVHPRGRHHNLLRNGGILKTWLLGSRLGQFVMLVFVGCALVVLGALSWMLSGGNESYNSSWWQSFWIAWCLFIDVGTQTGISVQDSGVTKFIAVMFSLAGFIYCLTLLGILVEVVRDVLNFLEAAYNKLHWVGHIVVLGWTDKTLILIDEIVHMLRDKEIRRLDLVILADIDEFKMSHDVRDYLQGRHAQGCRKLRLVCKQGSPHDLNDLRRVSLGTARTILVLGSNLRTKHADLEVMRKMVTLGCKSGEVSGYVFAEVLRSETTPALRTLFPNAEGIHARSAANRILVLKALRPYVGDCFCTMLTFSYGEELYVVDASDYVGCTFEDVCRLCTDSVCIGVQTGESRVILAPPDSAVIKNGDRLIVLAAHESAAISFSVPLRRRPRKSHRLTMEMWASRFHPDAIRNSLMFGSQGHEDTDGGCQSSMMAADLRANCVDRCAVILIMGWAEEIADVLHLLDAGMPASGGKCTVHVLSEVPLQTRQADLEAAAVGEWERIHLRHHVGSRLSVKCLGQLPLWDADAILVLSEARLFAMESDSECLTCAVTVSGIREGKYAGFHDLPRRWRGHIICEILDPRTDRLLTKNTSLMSKLTFFRSNALETGLFAMAVHEPASFNALVSLLRETPDGGALAAEAIATYDPSFISEEVGGPLPQLSFWDLHHRVRGSGDLLLGWRKHRGPVVLVPDADRHEALPWSERDRLIVIRKSGLDPKWGKATLRGAPRSFPDDASSPLL